MKKLALLVLLIIPLILSCSPEYPVEDDLYATTIYTYNGTAWNLVTSNYTPTIPINHHTTHENGGSDEIDVTGLSGLLADNQTPEAHVSIHNFGGSDLYSPMPSLAYINLTALPIESVDLWTTYIDGTGVFSPYWGTAKMSSGNVAGNVAMFYALYGSNRCVFSVGQAVYMNLQVDSTSSVVYRAYITDNQWGGDNADHIGFKIDGNTIYSSSGDGTAEESNAYGSTVSAWEKMHLLFWRTGTSEIKFYAAIGDEATDMELFATHTTRIPNLGNERPMFQVYTGSNAVKSILLNNLVMGESL